MIDADYWSQYLSKDRVLIGLFSRVQNNKNIIEAINIVSNLSITIGLFLKLDETFINTALSFTIYSFFKPYLITPFTSTFDEAVTSEIFKLLRILVPYQSDACTKIDYN